MRHGKLAAFAQLSDQEIEARIVQLNGSIREVNSTRSELERKGFEYGTQEYGAAYRELTSKNNSENHPNLGSSNHQNLVPAIIRKSCPALDESQPLVLPLANQSFDSGSDFDSDIASIHSMHSMHSNEDSCEMSPSLFNINNQTAIKL